MRTFYLHFSRKKLCLLLLLVSLLLTGCSAPGSLTDGFLPDSGPESSGEEAPETDDTSASPEEETPEPSRPEPPDAALPETQEPSEEPDRPDPGAEPEESLSASPEILALLDEIVSPSMSEYEKVKAIHDYLVIHTDYDYENLSADTLPDTAFTADGALLLHSAVCEGYAKAFSLLCDLSGIGNTLVYGTADDGTGVQSHAWNQVRVDGTWYNIDVTWDDPLMNGRVVTDGSNMIYDYFLVPDTVLIGNHTPEDPAALRTCVSDQYMDQNRRMTIEPWLSEPYAFTDTDEAVQDAVGQYLSDGVLEFQLVCDTALRDPQVRSEYVLNQVKEAMEARALYGQISVETQYGIADYAVIKVTIVQ